MQKQVSLFIFILLSNFAQATHKDLKPLELTWKFAQKDSLVWRNAVVPGCVHTDLVRENIIRDPFIGDAEKECKWVADKDWVYQSDPFDVSTSILNMDVVRFQFPGLDTYTIIYINDRIALKTDNAFRTWTIDAKPFLNKKDNVIRIEFLSPLKVAKERLAQLPYPLPGYDFRAVTRKPQFHFGWDWGPELVTCGITKAIELVAFNKAKIKDVYIRQDKVTEQLAKLTALFEIESTVQDVCSLEFKWDDYNTWKTFVEVKKGVNLVELPFEIQYPRLWWCNGMGRSYMYSFTSTLTHKNTVIDEQITRTGIRSIELINKKDSIGESFYFELNGKPVFMRGANFIPMNYFPAQTQAEQYTQMLANCKENNFNMLRVWGGGVYEDDVFYDACNDNGIMIWQDFMFACSMYPADSLFITNLIEEAEEQTRRLRNHPAMALWCGNNENEEAWLNWGWQSNLDARQKDKIWRAYLDVFELTLRPIVKKNTNTAYVATSPRYGRGDKRSMTEGDSHYWGLWHDAEDFEVLKTKIPRFMSEFGMQSFPSSDVLYEIHGIGSAEYGSKGFLQHQKHSRGFELMDTYMKKWYPFVSTSNLELYRLMTQAVQAEGITMGVEAQRRSNGRCMGTLYWQLNDVWPSFSWSSIDYKGNPKLLFHALRESYAPQMLSPDVINDHTLQIYWLNDIAEVKDSCTIALEFYDAFGGLLAREDLANTQLLQGVHKIYEKDLRPVIGKKELTDVYLVATITAKNGKPLLKRTKKLIPNSKQLLIPFYENGRMTVKRMKS